MVRTTYADTPSCAYNRVRWHVGVSRMDYNELYRYSTASIRHLRPSISINMLIMPSPKLISKLSRLVISRTSAVFTALLQLDRSSLSTASWVDDVWNSTLSVFDINTKYAIIMYCATTTIQIQSMFINHGKEVRVLV